MKKQEINKKDSQRLDWFEKSLGEWSESELKYCPANDRFNEKRVSRVELREAIDVAIQSEDLNNG